MHYNNLRLVLGLGLVRVSSRVRVKVRVSVLVRVSIRTTLGPILLLPASNLHSSLAMAFGVWPQQTWAKCRWGNNNNNNNNNSNDLECP